MLCMAHGDHSRQAASHDAGGGGHVSTVSTCHRKRLNTKALTVLPLLVYCGCNLHPAREKLMRGESLHSYHGCLEFRVDGVGVPVISWLINGLLQVAEASKTSTGRQVSLSSTAISAA
ncbi:hypothetical protein IAQ61_005821 [Plenodomus lingam]|uniref:uncharacterized protein n=1 Tax=Leptosphaeria maculans TaxID=5022 RepID=UPI003316C94D|nr:hypothetical protein IAQ61_005821 [Plenodomus lingam]